MYIIRTELSLAGVRNLEVLLTLFQPEGADYVHHITASTPRFENLTTSLFNAYCIYNFKLNETLSLYFWQVNIKQMFDKLNEVVTGSSTKEKQVITYYKAEMSLDFQIRGF